MWYAAHITVCYHQSANTNKAVKTNGRLQRTDEKTTRCELLSSLPLPLRNPKLLVKTGHRTYRGVYRGVYRGYVL